MFIIRRTTQGAYAILTEWLTKRKTLFYPWTSDRSDAKPYKRRSNAENELAWQRNSAKRTGETGWQYEIEEV